MGKTLDALPSRRGPRNRRSTARRFCIEPLESRRLLATFTVTDTSDNANDTSSLRYAITQSNLTGPGPNTIDFKIPGTGVQTIAPFSALPAITAPVIIDGTSQPGYNPNNPTPMIELTGSNIAAPNVNGLTIRAGNSTVKGMVINGFARGSGISINSNGNLVQGNYIGTNATGTNFVPNAGDGVVISPGSFFNTIGGTTPGAGNVISGNFGDGIRMTVSFDNKVQGNYIGTDKNGTNSIINAGNGVEINGSFFNTIGGPTPGAGNVISGNIGDGVRITTGSTDNLVQGNIIGLDATGAKYLGNKGNGVEINPVESLPGHQNTIGGPTPGAGNVISGNFGSGVSLGVGANGSLVQGNYIGTDITGTKSLRSLGNSGDGVRIEAADVTIGGPTLTPGRARATSSRETLAAGSTSWRSRRSRLPLERGCRATSSASTKLGRPKNPPWAIDTTAWCPMRPPR